MLVPNNPNIDFDELNKRIAAEVEKIETQIVSLDEKVCEPQLSLGELLALDGVEFISKSYIAITGKRPRNSVLNSGLALIRQGFDKRDVILSLAPTPVIQSSSLYRNSRQLKVLGAIRKLGRLGKFLVLGWDLLGLSRLKRLVRAQQFQGTQTIQTLDHHAEELRAVKMQVAALQSSLESALEQLDLCQRTVTKHTGAVAAFNGRLLDIESRQSESSKSTHVVRQTIEKLPGSQPTSEGFYLALEERFRGDETSIRERLKEYLPEIATTTSLQRRGARVADLGCGRGEWLSLLRDAGVDACGVELSAVNVELCTGKGLLVEHADVLEWLDRQPASSLAGVTSFHLIEHLKFEDIRTFLDQILRVLQPGGLLILETPNPENLITGSSNFYIDPTHQRPLPPVLLEFLVDYAGFEGSRIERLHPVGQEQHLNGTDETTTRLNHYLYGPQDYAVIASKPQA